jgi:hypothetical protein
MAYREDRYKYYGSKDGATATNHDGCLILGSDRDFFFRALFRAAALTSGPRLRVRGCELGSYLAGKPIRLLYGSIRQVNFTSHEYKFIYFYYDKIIRYILTKHLD